MRIIDPQTKEILIMGQYVNPSWIVKLKLIPLRELNNEIENYRQKTDCSAQQALEIGVTNEECNTKDLETGGDGNTQTNEIDINENNSISNDDQIKVTETDPNKEISKSKPLVRIVNPRVDNRILGLDQPQLKNSTINTTTQSIDVEPFNETIEQFSSIQHKNALTPGFLWHVRLGHASVPYLQELQNQDDKLKSIIFDKSINE